jgi:CDP-diacylglycerol---serine O-phosphatidyltransferase
MRHLPNLLTLLNLFCGCIAVVAVFHGRMDHVAILVSISLIADFFDGFAARMLNVSGPFGKELDAIADMVTFGFLPGVILYHLMLKSSYFVYFESRSFFSFLKYYMFIVPIFSALRLAKFNTDTRQSAYFIGLPTPANTLWIISLPFIIEANLLGLAEVLKNPFTLVGLASISAWIMIAEIPLLSLKIKPSEISKSKPQLLLLAGALLFILTLRIAAAPVIIAWYVLLSLIYPPDKKTTL